jgi:hypothetical protein
MNSEDQYILNNMIGYCDISPDLFFFCECGFLGNAELANLSALYSGDSYVIELNKLFLNWYENKANEYQQMLVDLYGFTQLNDQFDDLSTIVGLDIHDKLFPPEEVAPIRVIPYEGELTLPDDLNDLPVVNLCEPTVINLSDEENKFSIKEITEIRNGIETNNMDLPFYDLEDINNEANIVYTLAVSNKMHWRNQVNNLFNRLKNNKYNNIEIKDALDWLIKYKSDKEIAHKKVMESISEELDDDYYDNFDSCDDTSFMAKTLKINKNKEINYAKKAIKKGLKMLNNFISNDDFRLFTNGDGFTIEGNKFNYCFKKSHTDFIQHTLNPNGSHIPFDMMILDKNNIELCKACIYFNETPIIDQLLAIVLHLKSGNECEILSTANYYNRKPEFYTNEHFSTKYKKSNIKTNEVSDIDKYHSIIKDKVKVSIPSFLGIDVPELLIGKFRNLYFDNYLQEYQNTKQINSVLNAALSLS